MVSMISIRARPGAIAAAVLLVCGSLAHAGGPPTSLDRCSERIQRDPGDPVGYYCVYRYVLAGGEADAAVALLKRSFRVHPTIFRAKMFIAWIDRIRGRADWPETLREAVDGMESTGDSYGVVYGGLMLAFRLGEEGRLDEARAMVERCARAAEVTGDPVMEARVWVGEGVLAVREQDYSRDIHLLRKAEKVVFPDGPYDIRCTVADNLGSGYWYLGQYRRAFEAFQRAFRLRSEAHDLWWQAYVAHDMALCAMNLLGVGEMEPEEVDRLLTSGMELAVASSNGEIEAAMHILMGRRKSGESAGRHFRRALEIARREGDAVTEVKALELLGLGLAARGPRHREDAEALLREAERRARETGHAFTGAEVMASEALVATRYGAPEEAVRAHLAALDSIESLRVRAVPGSVRAQAFFHWGYAYHRLAGWLLNRAMAHPGAGEPCALAFTTMERFRARELLDRLVSHREVPREVVESEPYRRHQEVLAGIAGVQRTLADPGLDPAERATLLVQLDDLEEEESELRDELARRISGTTDPFRAEIPPLDEIQELLDPDQALLSYQLWDGEPGGMLPMEVGRSWLILVTRNRVWPIPLPARRELRARLEILEGLLMTRDAPPAEALRAAARVHEDLLGGALAALPPRIRRLVIVPDDVLFRCPFGALRVTEKGPPLARDYELSVVPSAAVWSHLKRREGTPRPAGRSAALVLCTPFPDGGEPGGGTFRAAGPWREGLRLAPLPHAGEEARALARAAGPGSVVLSGPAATEAVLKTMDLGNFTILDLVSHAVVDTDQPERSAIILAPGAADEDGLLQVREIPALSLDGQLVILSSCGSSAGHLLGGEGAQSLARAFLEAGGGAVLASLWPLEDRETAAVLTRFSAELGRGRRVADALRRAQGAAMDEGMPPAGWAGLMVLGNGDLRPVRSRPGRPWFALLGGFVVLAVSLIATLLWAR